MADYAGAISLSQAHSTDDSSSDHSPRSVPTRSSPATASASSSKPRTSSKHNKLSAVDHLHHQHQHQRHQIMIQSTPLENSSRKPRGRPPGSKNKPKPPIVITKDIDSAMKPVVLEISAGADIIDNIITFASKNHAGITVMSASGSVSHVTLRQPISHAHSLSLHGPFHLLSLSGSFFASSPSKNSSSSSSAGACSCFGVTLAGAQGHVFGGVVAGKVTAASLVVVVAATFSNPSIHSLPIREEGDQRQSDRQGDHQQQQETKPNITVSTTGATDQPCSTSIGKSIPVYGVAVANPSPLNCQIPPDVMHWAPPRPPY
ncbi:AT-hook motif nuclear-localized protein [Melia azedarach]|uniref:AT-hook motif nuclear-localized protein n=1 Tax=Melia azedarach TaxID=155640 RepID=A0ACC1YLP1_MELAZ|nr:AT-hook motif nuclear-localized protein [Melia azedarach]